MSKNWFCKLAFGASLLGGGALSLDCSSEAIFPRSISIKHMYSHVSRGSVEIAENIDTLISSLLIYW